MCVCTCFSLFKYIYIVLLCFLFLSTENYFLKMLQFESQIFRLCFFFNFKIKVRIDLVVKALKKPSTILLFKSYWIYAHITWLTSKKSTIELVFKTFVVCIQRFCKFNITKMMILLMVVGIGQKKKLPNYISLFLYTRN